MYEAMSFCKWQHFKRVYLTTFARLNAAHHLYEKWGLHLCEESEAELQQLSPEFRVWWEQHDIHATCRGPTELNHPSLGRMVFHTNTFQVVDAPDLRMLIFT